MTEIRYVRLEDRAFWYSLDKHLPQQEFDRKVAERRGYIITEDHVPVGLLRYNLFWDNTPFCTLLFVDWKRQRAGYGRLLMQHWEAEMKAQGYDILLTSTQAMKRHSIFTGNWAIGIAAACC